jgi:hypothetical protein
VWSADSLAPSADSILGSADGQYGSSYAVSLAKGTYSLAGQNLGLAIGNSIAGYNLVLSPAVINLSGADSQSAFELGPVFGTFSLAGETVTFSSTNFFPLSPGIFNLTGQAVQFGQTLNLSVGTFNLNGQSVVFAIQQAAVSPFRPVTVSGGRVVLPSKKVGETLSYTFDFISSLVPGETINTASVTSNVWSGVDSSPGSMVEGISTISGTQVNQLITAGIAGVIYDLICTIQTSYGQTVELSGYIAVQPDVP